ncbi:MAG: efflux RND transporter periplasmic adaptor subunit, partial [Candidatus Caenarcaniphilales bacterium]|nr:efflux RND transporter periplasmic adaptor subunit [Candidatus Caenarcaniphilales bacterium]
AKGQNLAVLESQEVTQLSATGETDQANYRSQVTQAKANLDLEQKRYEREKSLYEHKINTQKDLEAAENSLKNAQAALKAAQQNLSISTSSTDRRLKQIGATKAGQIYLKAPLSGEIVEIGMTIGQTVDLGQILMHGVNLSQVWSNGQVFEKDTAKVKLGQRVQVLPSESDGIHSGKIIFINPVIDSTQRTFAVKALLDNPNLSLKAGQFVQMRIETEGTKEQAILLAKNALVERNGINYVYVRSDGNLIPTKVQISQHKHKDWVEIESGLKVGDEVVVEGAYLLPAKAEATGEEHQSEKKILNWWWIIGGIAVIAIAFLLGRFSSERKN